MGLGDHREGDPSGLNSEPPHRDDSTFGEYMAALEHKSSSGNGVRRLSSSGASYTPHPVMTSHSLLLAGLSAVCEHHPCWWRLYGIAAVKNEAFAAHANQR